MNKERDPRPSRLTLERVTREAREMALRHGGHIPTLMIEDGQKLLIIQLRDLAATHDERADQVQTVGFTLAARREIDIPEQVFFITEAWLSIQDGNDAPILPPSQDPDRKEVLCVSQLDVTKHETNVVVSEMIRDDEDRLVGIRELDMHPQPTQDIAHTSPLLAAFIHGVALGLIGPAD